MKLIPSARFIRTSDTIIIYLSSLHVGTDPETNEPYLHLNDDNVDTLDDMTKCKDIIHSSLVDHNFFKNDFFKSVLLL